MRAMIQARIPGFRWLGLAAALAALALIALVVTPARAAISIEVKTEDAKDAPVAESVELYQSSHALVIGVNAYSAGWPKLRNAVKDAEKVSNGLKSLGFDVTYATNLKAEELRKMIKEFFVLKGAQPGARLLVWFAGHGHSDHGEGFLIPADGPGPGDPSFALYALPMREFGALMRLARSKHVLAIFDSCFSGTIFEARTGTVPAAITRATLSPVRQFLSSGDADQAVADNGSFRELFLRAVRGEEAADANGDGYLTGTELGGFLSDRVTNLTQGAQTPRFGKMLDINYDRGDFVFVLPNRESSEARANVERPKDGDGQSAAPLDSATMLEITFWNSIKDSSNTADFEAYLRQFPNGTFSSLARNRVETQKDGIQGDRPDPAPNAPVESGETARMPKTKDGADKVTSVAKKNEAPAIETRVEPAKEVQVAAISPDEPEKDGIQGDRPDPALNVPVEVVDRGALIRIKSESLLWLVLVTVERGSKPQIRLFVFNEKSKDIDLFQYRCQEIKYIDKDLYSDCHHPFRYQWKFRIRQNNTEAKMTYIGDSSGCSYFPEACQEQRFQFIDAAQLKSQVSETLTALGLRGEFDKLSEKFDFDRISQPSKADETAK